ncbi:DUF1566 domain-containing protein [Octadecabacter sp. 1_MG-2023]|uniref:Lcl C-terminal domain-containing protein n=1 Tax=unclassified Octadecabacter TaxID=196158 RepID=UPI001C0876A5|nr:MULTISPECIES: DUF1566 domain-containing protein [unclassified Octadecabacter]MBU2992640.1 DUF1566 domain-containing protein [Octadecabacter sp. B2R22]MDO6733909.1 DUF1566 domain-containing protein [Octadecabacter sp. 1_MG-2023]
MTKRSLFTSVSLALPTYAIAASVALAEAPFPIPDTMQSTCYDATQAIDCPAAGEAFFGQDAQVADTQTSYTDNGDGTITDNITGLMWAQTPDMNGDGDILAEDKMSYEDALASAQDYDLGGYDDWRVPTIKEMYSLMNFDGVDPSGYESEDTSGLIPFIDRDYFDFAYGDTAAGERIIDSQMVSTNLYVSGTNATNDATLFGVNFADGRIKGYGLTLHGQPKPFFVMYVRGDTGYGVNDYTDNGDGTVTDASTGLMWSQADNGEAISWEAALAFAQTANAESYLGHDDWRLPNIKELQGIVDYTRSPDTTDSPAIDPVFESTQITNEADQDDFGWVWSSTTHSNWTDEPGSAGAYISFGRAMGYFDDVWTDVHGAGSQRSDPKLGDAADFPEGNGPQGDAQRINNFVRLVRDVE